MTIKEIKKLVEDNLVVRIYCGKEYVEYIIKNTKELVDNGFVFQTSFTGSPGAGAKDFVFGSMRTVYKLQGIENSYLELCYDYFMDSYLFYPVMEPDKNATKRSSIPVVYLPFKKEIIDNYDN